MIWSVWRGLLGYLVDLSWWHGSKAADQVDTKGEEAAGILSLRDLARTFHGRNETVCMSCQVDPACSLLPTVDAKIVLLLVSSSSECAQKLFIGAMNITDGGQYVDPDQALLRQ
ncbi:unnamed protein product [Phytophthora fragariaefolia]|uniref:Unnamed protein product n=1 Tax=Phytophthora fragariaefolia TaxID=1490495 RepID=A0A9W6XIW5_9STRA|nr:unnamed protein product [Phytophthora fragariaefolia]